MTAAIAEPRMTLAARERRRALDAIDFAVCGGLRWGPSSRCDLVPPRRRRGAVPCRRKMGRSSRKAAWTHVPLIEAAAARDLAVACADTVVAARLYSYDGADNGQPVPALIRSILSWK